MESLVETIPSSARVKEILTAVSSTALSKNVAGICVIRV